MDISKTFWADFDKGFLKVKEEQARMVDAQFIDPEYVKKINQSFNKLEQGIDAIGKAASEVNTSNLQKNLRELEEKIMIHTVGEPTSVLCPLCGQVLWLRENVYCCTSYHQLRFEVTVDKTGDKLKFEMHTI
jgi:hypothetical protein